MGMYPERHPIAPELRVQLSNAAMHRCNRGQVDHGYLSIFHIANRRILYERRCALASRGDPRQQAGDRT